MFKTRNDLLAAIAAEERQAGIFERLAREHRDRISRLEQQLADLGNGNLSERRIARSTSPAECTEIVFRDIGVTKLADQCLSDLAEKAGISANKLIERWIKNAALEDAFPLAVPDQHAKFPAVSGVSGANDYADEIRERAMASYAKVVAEAHR